MVGTMKRLAPVALCLLALGEIAPEFEGKPVLLAERMNGVALGEGHWRLIVPGDRHGGRAVRDVATITLR